MADKTLIPGVKPHQMKYIVWAGMGLVGAAFIYMFLGSTEPSAKRVEPESRSLTNAIDTRSVSIEGLNTRLTTMEQDKERAVNELRNEVIGLRRQLADAVARAQKGDEHASLANQQQGQNALQQQTAIERRLSELEMQLGSTASQRITDGRVRSESAAPASSPSATQQQLEAAARQAREEAEARSAEERRLALEQAERDRQTQLYSAPVAPPAMAQRADNRGPTPRIAKFEGPEKPVVETIAGIPDLEIPAGSILSTFLLTGMEAPTGTRSDKNPLPVLLRIKLDAIMPNYARADIKECHLLGSAVGEMATERVQVRGETVSCILSDNTALEGSVKFFATDYDGKAGLRGTLVTRSGQMLSRAAGAALAQGLSGALTASAGAGTGGGTSVNLGGQSIAGGAMSGAQQGFDMLTEYYIDLAEQTFPVIEVPNGRWVDVILTEKLTVKFLRGRG